MNPVRFGDERRARKRPTRPTSSRHASLDGLRVKVLLLCGGLRAGSTNEALLRNAQHLSGSSIEAAYLAGVSSLGHFNPDDDHDRLPGPVVALRGAIGAADALLVCTPEYAGDLPGSFKNLLDGTVGGRGDRVQTRRLDQRVDIADSRHNHSTRPPDGPRLHGL